MALAPAPMVDSCSREQSPDEYVSLVGISECHRTTCPVSSLKGERLLVEARKAAFHHRETERASSVLEYCALSKMVLSFCASSGQAQLLNARWDVELTSRRLTSGSPQKIVPHVL